MVQSPFKDRLCANALFKIMVGCPDVFISLLLSIQTFFAESPCLCLQFIWEWDSELQIGYLDAYINAEAFICAPEKQRVLREKNNKLPQLIGYAKRISLCCPQSTKLSNFMANDILNKLDSLFSGFV